MKLYSTCRFCKKAGYETPIQGMLKYGVRHWAHPECGIERFGAEAFFRKLNAVQISALPWQIVEKHVSALIAAHPTAQLAQDIQKLTQGRAESKQ